MSGTPSSLVRDGKRNNCILCTSAADRPVACLSFIGARSDDSGSSVDGFLVAGDRCMLNRIVQWDSSLVVNVMSVSNACETQWRSENEP
jgi:hypothetical protein